MKTMSIPEHGITLAVNLRHSGKNDRNGLIPVGNPGKISNLSLKALLSTNINGSKILLLKSGNTLYVSENDDEPKAVAILDSEPTDAVKIGENYILLATPAGLLRLCKENSEWTIIKRAEYPAVAIYSDSSTIMASSGVSSAVLKDSDGAKGVWLGSEDTKNITKDILTAYGEILHKAKSAERLIQPVLARYKLYGVNEELLYVSCPILLTAPETGFQLTGSMQVTMDETYSKRNAFTLQASAYKPYFRISRHQSRTDVKYMIIEMTDQFDPVSDALKCNCALMTNSVGKRYISITMPGVTDMASPKNMIADALNDMENKFKSVMRIEKPFGNGMPYSSQIAKVYSNRKNTSTSIIPDSEISLPHAFTAKHLCTNGNNILMGDITRQRFDGHNILIMSDRNIGDSDWKASISVTFCDGNEKVVKTDSGATWNPVSLNPLLSYPSQDSTSMTIYLQSGTKTYRRSFPLTPAVNSKTAYYLEPDLMPITFAGYETETFITQTANPADKRYAGMVICSDVTAPHLPLSADIVSDSKITNITNAVAASSGWEQSRCRYYVFTANDVFAATYNNKSKLQAINHICDSGMENEECGTNVTGDGYYYLHNNTLLKIKGVKSETVTQVSANKICHDRIHNELWLIGETDIWVYQLDTKDFYQRKISGDIIYSRDNIITMTDGTSDVNCEITDSTTDIEWRDRYSMKNASRHRLNAGAKSIKALRSVYVDMAVNSADPVKIEIRADHGAGLKYSPLIYSNTYTGSINSPILIHTPYVIKDGYFVTVKGRVSGDCEIREVSVK